MCLFHPRFNGQIYNYKVSAQCLWCSDYLDSDSSPRKTSQWLDVYKTPFFVAMLNGNTQGVAVLRHWPMLKRKHWISWIFCEGLKRNIIFHIHLHVWIPGIRLYCTIWNFGVLVKLHHVPKLNRGKRFFRRNMSKNRKHMTPTTQYCVLHYPDTVHKRESENHHLHSGHLPLITYKVGSYNFIYKGDIIRITHPQSHLLRGPSARVTAGTFHPLGVLWPGHFREGLRRRREGLRRLVLTGCTHVVLGKMRKLWPVTLTYPPSWTQEDPVFCGKKSWPC